jgi:hypothetical protein
MREVESSSQIRKQELVQFLLRPGTDALRSHI